jgi:hypothetical protein
MIVPPNHENVDAWSHLIVAGMYSPGVVTLSGHERVIGWDDQAAKGQDGATSSRTGEPLGKFTASFYLVDEEYITAGESDFTEWELFQQLLESSTAGEEPVALEIYHPDLARNHFTAIVLGKMGAMVPDGKGGANIAVELREHRPKKTKPSGGASKTKTTPETAGDKAVRDAEKELQDLIDAGKNL